MREHLDPVVKADKGAQYVGDIGNAAIIATDLTWNNRAFFRCVRNSGLKLTIEFCQTISSEGVSPRTHKIQKFL